MGIALVSTLDSANITGPLTVPGGINSKKFEFANLPAGYNIGILGFGVGSFGSIISGILTVWVASVNKITIKKYSISCFGAGTNTGATQISGEHYLGGSCPFDLYVGPDGWGGVILRIYNADVADSTVVCLFTSDSTYPSQPTYYTNAVPVAGIPEGTLASRSGPLAGMEGEIRLYDGGFYQHGWLPCKGQLLSVAAYPRLFSRISNTYGGNGVDNFALPDFLDTDGLRQRFMCVDYHEPQSVLAVKVPAAIHGPNPGYYKAGDVLSFSLQMLDNVIQAGGPVSLNITIGATTHSCGLASGTETEFVFADYTVQSGDNGEVTSDIILNGATLTVGGVPAILSICHTVTGVTIDTIAPTTTFSALNFLNDTGISAADFITSTATQTITAALSTALASTERVLGSLDNGNVWVDITHGVMGTSLFWNNVTLPGSSTLLLKVVDLAGNEGPVTSQSYVLDTVGATTMVSNIDISNDSGQSSSDFITKETSQTITAVLSGSGLLGGEELYGSIDNGVTWGNITDKVSGTSITWDGVTLFGSGTIKLEVRDIAGNAGTATSQAYVLDITAPITPTLTLTTDSGNNNSDGITNIGNISVGSLESGATWEYSSNNGITWTSGTGTSFTLTSGTYTPGTIRVKQTDVAGNVSAFGSNTTTIIVDTTAPTTPTVNTLTTADTTPAITGTATVGAGEILSVVVNGVTYTVGADLGLVDTAWTLVIPAGNALAIGTYNVTATVTDIAGNISTDSTSGELVITA